MNSESDPGSLNLSSLLFSFENKRESTAPDLRDGAAKRLIGEESFFSYFSTLFSAAINNTDTKRSGLMYFGNRDSGAASYSSAQSQYRIDTRAPPPFPVHIKMCCKILFLILITVITFCLQFELPKIKE